MPKPLIAQTANSSVGNANSPRAPTTFPVGAAKHMMIRPMSVHARPQEIVHLRPIFSAIDPAVAKPTTEATPPRIVRIIVALETLLR